MGTKQKSRLYDILPLLVCGLSVPLSLFMWAGNLTFAKFLYVRSEFGEESVISPTRWLFSTVVSVCLAVYAYVRKSTTLSGALLGLIVSVILSIASHAFFVCLVVFFFTSTRATKFRGHVKKKVEYDFKEGGQRNWAQVLCNCGMAAQLALFYLLDCGSGELTIDFEHHYRPSWLGIGILSAFACSNGDTWASELGSVLSTTDPFLITTRKKVPRGTNGAVSVVGLVVSLLGGLVIGSSYYLTIVYTAYVAELVTSPPQWPLIVVGGAAGLIGSLVDSLLGATVQYSGITTDGKIVESPGKGVKHISGLRILDNHSVNLISSIVIAISMPYFANKFWPVL